MGDEKKILVVDDDPAFARLVEQVLTAQGYQIIKADNGKDALRLLFSEKPDLVLLDVVMPGMDGWETCQRMRELSDTPIVIITGSQITEDAVVRGLECGADDYLIKPIGNKELVARVRAVLRRAPREEIGAAGYSDGYLSVNFTEPKVTINGIRVKLTPREFRLLAHLVANPGRVLSHRQLLEKVWGWEYMNDLDYVRIYISHLRQKIEPNPASPRYIITEPGFGYQFQRSG